MTMLALKPFRDAAAGVADLMPWATLMADGVIVLSPPPADS